MAYQYPDKADGITLSIVLSKHMATEELDNAENAILSNFGELFREKTFETLLDLGCGKGRLILKFADFFNRVTALDPDENRLCQAKNFLIKNKIQNVDFIPKTIEDADLANDSFDVVICNQIIQHVPTSCIEPMMKEVSRVLKKKGVLILTTSHSSRGQDFFLKAYLKNGDVKTAEITEQEFNGLTTNTREILPIHYFYEKTIETYLSSFKTITTRICDDLYPHNLLDTLLYVGEK